MNIIIIIYILDEGDTYSKLKTFGLKIKSSCTIDDLKVTNLQNQDGIDIILDDMQLLVN